jgi:hypothetical protein
LNLILGAVLLLATAFPSNGKTAWMRLESFRLAIGMPRNDALRELKTWQPKKGSTPNEIVVDYDGERALTVTFKNDRVQSVRFELYTLLPETRKAFEEQRAYLRETRGEPRKTLPSVLIYDNVLPNVMVVVNDDPNSEQGKKGVGVLAVRFYDPR